MKRGFLRYLCFYCASRFLYSTVRNATRPRPAARQEALPNE